MIRANEFARDLRERLNRTLRPYKWQINWRPAGERESVDLVGQPQTGKWWLLIEIELRRDDPSANVIKVWKWKKQRRLQGEFVLIQAFSRFYTRRSHRLVERAEFVGECMKRDKAGKYISIRFKFNPRKHGRIGGGRRRHHARYLAGKILRRLRKARIV